MNTAIARKTSIQDTDNLVILINDAAQLEGFSLSQDEMDYATKCLHTKMGFCASTKQLQREREKSG